MHGNRAGLGLDVDVKVSLGFAVLIAVYKGRKVFSRQLCTLVLVPFDKTIGIGSD